MTNDKRGPYPWDAPPRGAGTVGVYGWAKCRTCTNKLLPGESCEDCERERAKNRHEGPVDLLAKRFSPDVEHFPGKGFRVGVWHQKKRSPFIEIGWAQTWNEVNTLLVTWRPS